MITQAKLDKDFPMVAQARATKQVVYLDNASTTQKPQEVIEAIKEYYSSMNANIERGAYQLATKAGQQVQRVRAQVAKWLGGAEAAEIIFTAGTTASLNMVADSYGAEITAGDEVIVSAMEHHSNFLPWQVICQRKGATLNTIPLTPEGTLDLRAYEKLLTPRTKIVACTYVSNVLGTINPIKEIIRQAHQYQAITVIDAAQAIGHIPIDVKELDCDFLALSGHKAYGPTGIGILYGKSKHLVTMMPPRWGGGMVDQVTKEKFVTSPPPHRLEAGTPHLAGIIGLGATITFLDNIGYPAIIAHEQALTTYLRTRLSQLPHVRIIKDTKEKIGIFSFVVNQQHTLDTGILLNLKNIALRTGHHCAAPLLPPLNVESTVRISLALYNNQDDIDILIHALQTLKQ